MTDIGSFLGTLDLPASHPFAQVMAPAVRLRSGPVPDVGASKLGGIPDLPATVDWPRWDARSYFARELGRVDAMSERARGNPASFLKERADFCRSQLDATPRPLTFLGQLRTEQLSFSRLPFPADGLLLFFYDVAEQPWGYDPAHKGAWHVHFVPAGTPVAPREYPSGHDPQHVISLAGVTAEATWTFPETVESGGETLCFFEHEDLAVALDAHDPGPRHQVGGHPEQIQGDMTVSCALVSQGVYLGEPPDIPPDELERMTASAPDWRLLFQFASDDDLGVMWGDLGNLYFWIREEDLRSGDWSQAWFQLQCG